MRGPSSLGPRFCGARGCEGTRTHVGGSSGGSNFVRGKFRPGNRFRPEGRILTRNRWERFRRRKYSHLSRCGLANCHDWYVAATTRRFRGRFRTRVFFSNGALVWSQSFGRCVCWSLWSGGAKTFSKSWGTGPGAKVFASLDGHRGFKGREGHSGWGRWRWQSDLERLVRVTPGAGAFERTGTGNARGGGLRAAWAGNRLGTGPARSRRERSKLRKVVNVRLFVFRSAKC